MHSQRRIRLLLVAVVIILVFIIYLSGDKRRQNQRFYQQTTEAMDHKAAARRQQQQDRDDDDDDGSLFRKLKPGVGEERVVAPDRQKFDGPPPQMQHGDGDGVIEGDVPDERKLQPPDEMEIPIAGRKKMPGVPADGAREPSPDKHDFDPEVEAELNAILKRSPIIVFSKSHCPFSRKAKNILLEKYNIVPAPFVVELDKHSLGPKLQEVIAGNTGRKTVPNILVSGRSIGGGDEIEAMDESGELSSKIKQLAGKRVTEVSQQKWEKAL